MDISLLPTYCLSFRTASKAATDIRALIKNVILNKKKLYQKSAKTTLVRQSNSGNLLPLQTYRLFYWQRIYMVS